MIRRKCFFIEPHSRDNFFHRPATYGYADDAMRFAFFSKAALEFMLKANKRPDVIHCHDWQTGLVPVLLFENNNYGSAHLARRSRPYTSRCCTDGLSVETGASGFFPTERSASGGDEKEGSLGAAMRRTL